MKVNESVNAANLLMVGMQASNVSAGLSDASANDFAGALSNASNKASSYEPKPSASNVKEVDETEMEQSDFKHSDLKKTDTNIKDDKISDLDASQNEKEDALKTGVTSEEASDEDILVPALENPEGPLDEDKMQDVLDVLSTLIQDISRILDIPVASVVEKLEAMDMDVGSLLNTDDMMNVFLNIKDATPMDLLTNEDLSNQIQMLNGAVKQALEELEALQMEQEDVAASVTFDAVLMETVQVEEADVVLANSNLPTSNQDNEVKSNGQTEPVVIVEDNRINKPVELTNENNRESSDDSNLWKENDSGSTWKDSDSQSTKGNVKDISFQNPILQNIQNSFEQFDISAIGETKNVTPAQILDQIVEQVKVQMNQDSTSLEMQLYPEHLGKIQINVVSKEGVMTAHIVAESEAAKQAIEGGLASLRDAMEQQNLKVDAIEVMVSTTGFDQRNENQGSTRENTKSKSNRKIDLSELDEEQLDEEDVAEVEKMKASGSSVSYSI